VRHVQRQLEEKRGYAIRFRMAKIVEQWFLFEYIEGQLTPLSKPLKSRKLAEKEREKFPEQARKKIGVGVVRVPGKK
jgi:hypothetical protein